MERMKGVDKDHDVMIMMLLMVVVIDGDGDEADGEYVIWLLKMLHCWYTAVLKDFIKFDLHLNKPNLWQSYKVTLINKMLKSTI